MIGSTWDDAKDKTPSDILREIEDAFKYPLIIPPKMQVEFMIADLFGNLVQPPHLEQPEDSVKIRILAGNS